jgi:hypothetical protein
MFSYLFIDCIHADRSVLVIAGWTLHMRLILPFTLIPYHLFILLSNIIAWCYSMSFLIAFRLLFSHFWWLITNGGRSLFSALLVIALWFLITTVFVFLHLTVRYRLSPLSLCVCVCTLTHLRLYPKRSACDRTLISHHHRFCFPHRTVPIDHTDWLIVCLFVWSFFLFDMRNSCNVCDPCCWLTLFIA